MEKYNDIKDGLAEIQFIIDRLKVTICQGKHINAVDTRIYNSVIKEYIALGHRVEQIKKIIDGILLCKDDSDKLDFFLKNIYVPEQFVEDFI